MNASILGFILNAIFATDECFRASELITSISCADSQLKQLICAARAASISLSVLPTPANTISEGLKPAEIAAAISLKLTQSAPKP